MKINIQLIILLLCLLVNADILIAQWTKVEYPDSNNKPGRIVADSNYIYMGSNYSGLIRSSDTGVNWSYTGFGPAVISNILPTNKGIFISSYYNSGLYCSTDDCVSWNVSNSGLEGHAVEGIYEMGENLFVSNWKAAMHGGGYEPTGVYKSTNGGESWFAVNSGLQSTSVLGVFDFESIDSNLFVGTPYGIYRSTNSGDTWALANQNHGFPSLTTRNCLFALGQSLFAGIPGGVYRTTDYGANWIFINNGMTGETKVDGFAGYNSNLFAGTSNGVYLSTNNGNVWQKINDGLTELDVKDVVVFKQNLFCRTTNYIWKRPLSEIVSVEDITTEIPNTFTLNQNYPNPFNPSTTISFSLPTKEFVTLKIYDALGKEVITLVNEELNAGSYKNDWNAGNLSSGVYFYRLQAGIYNETKKLLLLK